MVVADPRATRALVALMDVQPQGAGYVAKDDFNLVASSDEWMSPVFAEVGPDGAVYSPLARFALGRPAANQLLGTDAPITTIHGFSSEKIVPVYAKYDHRGAYVSISDADREVTSDGLTSA